MKMRLPILVLIVLALALSVSACANSGANPTAVVTITTSVEKYALAMSSVPGLPLTVTVLPEAAEKYSFVWQTSEGEFLSWNETPDDFQVKNLGSSCTIDFATVYWSPLSADDTMAAGAEITLEVRDSETGSLIGQTAIVIEGDGLYYSIG